MEGSDGTSDDDDDDNNNIDDDNDDDDDKNSESDDESGTETAKEEKKTENTETAAPGDEWKCSSCTRVDQSIPMIGCDSCDKWFHWSCVGIVAEPRKDDTWVCSDCRRVKPLKKQKDKFKVSSSSSYSAQPSSTRPGSSGGSAGGRTSGVALVKTGSGHPKKSVASSLSSGTSSQSSSSAILATPVPLSSSSTGAVSGSAKDRSNSGPVTQGWECASCKTCKAPSVPMIGCDTCDSWHHWLCVGIRVAPHEEDPWFCPKCTAKQPAFTSILQRT